MERRRLAQGLPLEPEGAKPVLLDSCYGLRRGGEAAVVRWGAIAAAPPG
jgi:hypothetical protein